MATIHLTIVRHGETEWNRAGRWQGHGDSPLTAIGRAQAAATARALADHPFDRCVASDLGRAWATAQTIIAHRDLALVAEPRLRERHLGVCQGLTPEEMAERHPEEHARIQARDANHVIAGGGESRSQVRQRFAACLAEWAAGGAGHRLLAVSHGGILDHCFRLVVGLDLAVPRTWHLANAGINRLSCRDGRWRLDTWGEVGHLVGDTHLDEVDSRA